MTISTARFKSLEFVLLVLTNIAIYANVVAGNTLDHRAAIIASSISVGAYALVRGLAKFNADGKPFYQTSEFWLAVIAAAGVVVSNLQGEIGAQLMSYIVGGLALLTAIANGLRTPPAKAVGNGVALRAPGDGVMGD